MTDIDGIINACQLLKWYCGNHTDCGHCLHSHTCYTLGVDNLSRVMGSIRADLIVESRKEKLSSAKQVIDELCVEFNKCDECPFGECTICPKNILANKLDQD